ncbi:MAG: VWA domain-containing protein [Bryobacteraceae bacterium]
MKLTRGGCCRAGALLLFLPFAPVLVAAPVSFQFSASSEMVVLHATVDNSKGIFVPGLSKDDFHVWEDGTLQKIEVFQSEDVPVSVALVVDNSGSMRRKRAEVAAAARAFVQRSNPDDELFVVNFNDSIRVSLPPEKIPTLNASSLDTALSNANTGGKTALYDAIWVALERLQKSTMNKKVLIAISDGGDNASLHTLQQVVERAERSNVVIYTIGLFDDYDTDKNPKVLKRLARETGGQTFLPQDLSNAVPICKLIAADIRNQYTIGYVPSNAALDGTYRRIKVTARAPHHGALMVRTRAGYLASATQSPVAAKSEQKGHSEISQGVPFNSPASHASSSP